MVVRALAERRDPYCARIAPARALARAPAGAWTESAGELQSNTGMDPGGTPSTGARAAMARDSAKARRVSSFTMASPSVGSRCGPADGRDRPEGGRRVPG